MDPIIYIVDDNVELAQALALNLETAGYQTRLFDSAVAFLESYNPQQLSCLLLDVRMPGMTGDELQQALIEQNINIPIVFVSGYSDVPVIVETLKKGAVDFLTKPIDTPTLIKTINIALQQDAKQRKQAALDADVLARFGSLSKREHDILPLIVRGKLNKVIAYEKNLSIHTVENHRANIMRKMQANTVAELVGLCITNGLVNLQDDNVQEDSQ